jgi:N-acetylglucosaminyldiphosphoundecaprenol N-acetyl-beta-D-mannosaminyltransferase
MTPHTAEFARIPEAAAPPASEAAARPQTAEVLGVPLALTDYAGTMDWIDAMVAERRRGYLSAAAVHLVMVAQENEPTRDGRPRRDARRARRPAARLGPALPRPRGQPRLRPGPHGQVLRALGEERTRMYLYGGRNQGALVELALRLRHRFPGLQIVGGYSPPFRPLSDEERDWVVDDINRSKADVVWVGIGQPKQEIWMRQFRDRLDAPMLAGVGAAFDFHAGLVPQAPSWMQATGLEWLYRLVQEPRRLWRRYARYNPRFVAGFARQYAGMRAGAR